MFDCLRNPPRTGHTSNGDVMRFSTVSTTPSFVFTPTAVEPSCTQSGQLHGVLRGAVSTLDPGAQPSCRTLIASIAYSTWKRRPSGLNVLTPLSYSLRVRNMVSHGASERRRVFRHLCDHKQEAHKAPIGDIAFVNPGLRAVPPLLSRERWLWFPCVGGHAHARFLCARCPGLPRCNTEHRHPVVRSGHGLVVRGLRL